MSPAVRTITEEELPRSLDVLRTAFQSPPASDEAIAARRPLVDLDRCLGAYDDGGRLCGVARSFAVPLTVPGGGEVSAGAVTSVGVLPTHRRQGHLGRLMRTQLADVAARGEAVAILIAAEYPIYGRYGYGPAIEAVGLRLDAASATWRDAPSGSVEIVDNQGYAKVVGELYERVRLVTPGHIGWFDNRWQLDAGVLDWHDGDDARRREATKVVWRDESGQPQAATGYNVTESWVHNRPQNTITTDTLVATSPRAEHEMLRFLASVDWVSSVEVPLRPVDDPAPLALVDARAARLVDRSDHIWLRVLDVPAALTARRYACKGSLVLDVADPGGPAQGRFRLDAGPDGAECIPTTAEPDLAVDVGTLGAAYLGGQSWARLDAAGWVGERRPGAVADAASLFATARAPWCALSF
jgi:predicted acetyltransferase